MLARRGRLNFKPNVAKATQRSKPAEEKPKTPDPDSDGESPPSTVTQPSVTPVTPLPPVTTLFNHSPNEELPYTPPARPLSPMSALMRDPAPLVTEATSGVFAVPKAPERAVSPAFSECSNASEARRNERRAFNGYEPLDTKNMRIMDMINWNPKNGQQISKKKTSEVVSSVNSSPEKMPDYQPKPNRTLAPQVKLGPDGSLILDESSLVVEGAENDTSIWETVDDDRIGRKVTSLSFRNRLWRKGTLWTEKENELFYEILRCTGPDFGLMHEYFPARARCELKSKYNREERLNWEKMKEILAMPRVLDDSLLDRVARLQQEIEEEALAKMNKKKRGGKIEEDKKRPPLPPATIEWDENTADLVGEAEEIIRRLEMEAREDACSTASSADSDENWAQEKPKKRKKISLEAQKIINEAKQAARASERVAAQGPKQYAGFEEVDEASADEELIVVEKLEKMAKPEIDPTLKKAVKQLHISNSKRSAAEKNEPSQDQLEATHKPEHSEPSVSSAKASESDQSVEASKPAAPRLLSRLKKPPPIIRKS